MEIKLSLIQMLELAVLLQRVQLGVPDLGNDADKAIAKYMYVEVLVALKPNK